MTAWQKRIRSIVNPIACMNSSGFDDTANNMFVFTDQRMLVAIPTDGQEFEHAMEEEYKIPQNTSLLRWKEMIRQEAIVLPSSQNVKLAVSNNYLTKLSQIGEELKLAWKLTEPVYWDIKDQGDYKPIIYTCRDVTVAIMKAVV